MPWTLYRYILRDLLKLLVLTTVVLVTVISFAAAIKPMSEGLLGPAALAKFVMYSAPTMLAFALPFAGAFAATLVFLRMGSDNEIVACSASGMSYVTVLLPVIVLGLTLTMGMFFLSNWVIPSFYRAAAQTVEADMMTVLVNELNQDRPFDRLENTVLYADHALERQPPEMEQVSLQPSKLIELHGVAVGQLDDQGKLRSDMTAQRASVLLYHGRFDSWITIRLREVMVFDPLRGSVGYTELWDVPTIRLPSPFQDDPEFLSWPQLKELREHPELYHEISEYREELAQAVAAERLRQALQKGLLRDDSARVTLHGSRAGEVFVLSAPSAKVQQGAFHLVGTADEPVLVQSERPGLPDRRYEAASATVRVVVEQAQGEPSLHVTLHQARVYDARRPGFGEWTQHELPRLVWPHRLVPENHQEMSNEQLLQLSTATIQGAGRRQPSALMRAVTQLGDELTDLAKEIFAQLHARAASAVSCLLLLVLGAVLSLDMKKQMPLVVYFWSFMLALVTIILIHTGANMAGGLRFPLYIGLGVLWSGNVLLAVIIAAVYCRMARN